MGTETYPKKSHSVGDCKTTNWPEGSATSYPGVGVVAKTMHRFKTKLAKGGAGSANKTDYRKSRETFDTERGV